MKIMLTTGLIMTFAMPRHHVLTRFQANCASPRSEPITGSICQTFRHLHAMQNAKQCDLAVQLCVDSMLCFALFGCGVAVVRTLTTWSSSRCSGLEPRVHPPRSDAENVRQVVDGRKTDALD
jgi:hypothetical protein